MTIGINTRLLLHGQLEGLGWYIFETTRRLVAQHPDVQFVFFFDRPFHPSFIFADNVTAVVLAPPTRHPILMWLWYERALPRAMRQHHVDVLLSADNFCSLRSKIPTCLVIHDLAYLHLPDAIAPRWLRWYSRMTPRYVRRAEQIVAVSEATKQDILRHFSPRNPDITVSFNGCKAVFAPISTLQQQAIRERYSAGENYFLYVGALHPRKNVARLIAAFDQFKRQTQLPTRLLIGGRKAWQTHDIQTAYQSAAHQADILFLGYVSDEELPALVASALALTYLSLFEGFGVPLLEALNCDVPCITSNVSSMPEVVGAAGICVDPTDIVAIAQAMTQIATNGALRQQLIEQGRTQRQRFTWDYASDVLWAAITKIYK